MLKNKMIHFSFNFEQMLSNDYFKLIKIFQTKTQGKAYTISSFKFLFVF